MLFEKVVRDMSRIELQELLEEKLMDLIVSIIDGNLLNKADREILNKLVDEYEIEYLSLKEKTTLPDQE